MIYHKVTCQGHETVIIVTDILWEGIKHQFLRRKIFFLWSLCLFLASCFNNLPLEFGFGQRFPKKWLGTSEVSQSILSVLDRTNEIQIALFVCRTLIYLTSLPKLLYDQVKLFCEDVRGGYVDRSCRIPIPQYLLEWQGCGSLVLFWLLLATQLRGLHICFFAPAQRIPSTQ